MSCTGYQNRIGCTGVLFQHESNKPTTHKHILETLSLVMNPPPHTRSIVATVLGQDPVPGPFAIKEREIKASGIVLAMEYFCRALTTI